MKKKGLIMGLILAVIVCLLIPIIIYASSVVRPELSFDGATGKCMASITAAGKEIEAEMELKKGDVVIQSWKGNAKSALVLTGTCENCDAGVTYTLVVRGTVNGKAFAEKKVEGELASSTSTSKETEQTIPEEVIIDKDEEKIFRGVILMMGEDEGQYWMAESSEDGKKVRIDLSRYTKSAMTKSDMIPSRPEKTEVKVSYKGYIEKDDVIILAEITDLKLISVHNWYADFGFPDPKARRIFLNLRIIGEEVQFEEKNPEGYRLETEVRFGEDNHHYIDWILYNDTEKDINLNSVNDFYAMLDPVYSPEVWMRVRQMDNDSNMTEGAETLIGGASLSGSYDMGSAFSKIPIRFAKQISIGDEILVVYADIDKEEFGGAYLDYEEQARVHLAEYCTEYCVKNHLEDYHSFDMMQGIQTDDSTYVFYIYMHIKMQQYECIGKIVVSTPGYDEVEVSFTEGIEAGEEVPAYVNPMSHPLGDSVTCRGIQ